MPLTIFTWLFTNKIGQFVGIALLLGLLSVGVWGWMKIHDMNVKSLALAEFNKAQLEQTVKDLKDFTSKLDDLNKKAEESTRLLQEKNAELDNLSKSLVEKLAKLPIKGKDNAAHPLLQETIKGLRGDTP